MEELRIALQLTDDSPVMLRALRDHLDRPDERLEEWAESAGRRGYVDSDIAPLTALEALDVTRYLRHFDPETWWLNLRGESYDLRLLIEEVGMLLLRIRALGWD